MLGALLAAAGLYGLLAYTVARRINEIGIRMALGATRSEYLRMVLADALAMVAAGLAIGDRRRSGHARRRGPGIWPAGRYAVADRVRPQRRSRGGPAGGVCAGAPRVPRGPDGGAALRIGVAHALVRAASPLLATQAEFAAHPEKAGTLAEAEPLDA